MANVLPPTTWSGIGGRPHVLFLTANAQREKATDNWNTELLAALERIYVDTTVLSYLEDVDTLTAEHVAQTYTHVCLLLLGEYPSHHTAFIKMMKDVVPTAQSLNPRLRVLNGPGIAAWNSDKSYLQDVKAAGFAVPDTMVLSSRQPIDYVRFAINTQTHGNAVVVKPSISASGRNTHLISDPQNLDDKDDEFLRSLLDRMQNGCTQTDRKTSAGQAQTDPKLAEAEDADDGSYGSILLQEYMPEIKAGEYSLCYVGTELQYTVLKKPAPDGWMVHKRFGGTSGMIDASEVPRDAIEVSGNIMGWLAEQFEGEELCYARIDGVIRADGSFVIMEVELIEPNIFLSWPEAAPTGLDALCKVITRPPGGLDKSQSLDV